MSLSAPTLFPSAPKFNTFSGVNVELEVDEPAEYVSSAHREEAPTHHLQSIPE